MQELGNELEVKKQLDLAVTEQEKVQSYEEEVKKMEDIFVILGGGTAGCSAAAEIRKKHPTASILLISEEPYLPYNRPMLTKVMREDLAESSLVLRKESWYQEQKITLMLGKKVSEIRATEKEVVLEDGMKIAYTKLIYALGAECFIPPLKGKELDGVYAIRRLEDARNVAKRLQNARHAVVIGGGVLGLEAAWEMHQAGCEVVVLEAAPVLMGRQLDKEAGELLQKISEEQGIRIQTGAEIEEIEGNPDGTVTGNVDGTVDGAVSRTVDGNVNRMVTGVRLKYGEVIPADLVIVSCGIKANTDIAKAAGISVNRAITVNEKMETSLPDIYACGDCAEYNGINLALWREATEQGKAAGKNAAGETTVYRPIPAALNFRGMNTTVFAAGDNGQNPEMNYKTLEIKDRDKKLYQKYSFLDDALCGAILIGDTSRMAKVLKALETHMTYQECVSWIY